MSIKFGGVQKFSLLDFPDKISAIVFTKGCNFHCGYCHNPELFELNSPENWNTNSIIEFLKTRVGKLDGVVVTGGEPTIYNDLVQFIKEIKNLNLLVKLDTNGTNPNMLDKLIKNNLIDYIAMDIKAPLDKYSFITNSKIDTQLIQSSIDILKKSSVPFEFRTTVVKSQLSYDDFEKIGKLIQTNNKYFNGYYLQKFIPSKTLDKALMNETSYSDEEFIEISKLINKYIKKIEIR